MGRAILVCNHTCDFISNSLFALVRFWNHADDFRPIKLYSTQFSYHYLSLDATIMVSKNCAIVGERVLIIFVTIGYRSNKNTLNCSFRGLLFKNGRVKAWWDATFGKVLKRICTRGPEPPLSCRQSLPCPSPLTDQPLAEFPDCFLIIQNHFWRVAVGLSVCCKTA